MVWITRRNDIDSKKKIACQLFKSLECVCLSLSQWISLFILAVFFFPFLCKLSCFCTPKVVFLCNQKIKYFSNVNYHSHSRYLHKTFAITNNLSTNLHLPKIWLNCLCVRIDYDGRIHHFNSSIDVCYLNAIENVENVSLSSTRTSNQSE